MVSSIKETTTLEQRLEAFPTEHDGLDHPVTIRWNTHQIPYIEAQSEDDAAFALGLVHAHLRLGQMEILKRIAQGRVSEMAGPFTVKLDKALRTLNFDRAVDDIIESQPENSKRWLNRFVDGINAYRAQLTPETQPQELSIMNISLEEKWTAADTLALGRLFGTDVNWLTWFELLEVSDRPDFEDIVERYANTARSSQASFTPPSQRQKVARQTKRQVRRTLALLSKIVGGMSKSGSNSAVVSGDRNADGDGGLIANDPHLGFEMPNAWLIAGLDSPEQHVMGFMPPGVPIFGFGRTKHIAWGGTNLRSLSSDLVDVTDLPPEQIKTRTETIKVRWWPDTKVDVRETPFGPVMTDSPLVPNPNERDLAIRWIGHQVSDEITALRHVAQAKNFQQFRDALEPFSLPGQNFLYTDLAGNIGEVVSTHLPMRRDHLEYKLIHSPAESNDGWQRILTVKDLPYDYNPDDGFLASANNRPVSTPYPIGLFFLPDERIRRLQYLLSPKNPERDNGTRVDVTDLMALQRDVTSLNSLSLMRSIIGIVSENPQAYATESLNVIERMKTWNGAFTVDSHAAVLFMSLLEKFAPIFYEAEGRTHEYLLVKDDARLLPFLREDLANTETKIIEPLLNKALRQTAKRIKPETQWGDIHRLKLGFIMSNIPVVGRRFDIGNYPIGGSGETVQKSAHPHTSDKHDTFYGAQSRHISDMSDLDKNWVVLVGGQDGWLSSTTRNDQTPLFLRGDYIHMPMKPSSRAKAMPFAVVLKP